MAKWIMNGSALKSSIEYDGAESHWKIEQDEKPFLEQAKLDRENAAYQKKDLGYKKFATIPEVVAIEVKDKWGVDIHDPTITHDKEKMAKFMQIIKQHYGYLMSY